MPLSAAALYAISQGSECNGTEECHWCASPCKRLWLHDEPTPAPYTRVVRYCKRPGAPYVCSGCWHWRRRSVSVRFLDGRMVDRKAPPDFSWLITPAEAWGIDFTSEANRERLLEILLSPPPVFSLILHDGENPSQLQYAEANDHKEARADTPLFFTRGNVKFSYTVFDLEQVLKHPEIDANEPGVRTLISVCGRPEVFVEKEGPKKGGQSKKPSETGGYANRVVSSKMPILKSA